VDPSPTDVSKAICPMPRYDLAADREAEARALMLFRRRAFDLGEVVEKRLARASGMPGPRSVT
jgi:hypothetical protein